MARINNNMRTIARNAMAYMENQIHTANKRLKMVDEFDRDNPGHTFTTANVTTYKNKLKQDAKASVQNTTKMIRWLFSEFNITTIPSAYTDAEVDAIDADIRTHEDPDE